ncbi:unnamed protein product [Paramecium sonneborni]|uniref:Uncharacterized protein n=1 Tax=Paramecium sonneborni TaxID=65129 RepID=A0A8S1QEK6_9CILI|nr:unnamed protein product [Paramecium sonneborni]
MSVDISQSNHQLTNSIPQQQVTTDNEILDALLSRKPFYESLFDNLVKMGLPVLSINPNQNFINSINNDPFDIPSLQRLISIKLEGQPISFHRSKLAHQCKNFITQSLNTNQNIELEHMLALIKKTTDSVFLPKISRLDYSQLNYDQEFNYTLFLKLLNMNHVHPISTNLTFTTTEISGYYEIKNIEDLRDHEQIDTFIAVRKLRQQIFQIIESIAEILDSLDSLHITRIEDAFLRYINVKASLQLPFTKSINQECIEKYISEDLPTEESAQNFSKVIITQKINDHSKTQEQSTKKIKKITKEDYYLKQKKENQESTKVRMKNDNIDKFMRKSAKNQLKKCLHKSISQWDQERQVEFEKKISNLDKLFISNFIEIQQSNINNETLAKPNKPNNKRKVYFDVFDSCRYYNGKIIDFKIINPRKPFFQYSFIEYNLDSEEEVAEDVCSEERSVDMTSSESLQEFIELDIKNSFIQNEEPFTLIFDPKNYEQFSNYKAIILSDITPIFEQEAKTNQNNKQLSKSAHLKNKKDLIVKTLENILTPIKNESLQFLDTEFLIIPESVEKL